MISKYVVCFMLFSFLGWVWETIFCTITERHFCNRGFLFGPVCPIYGFSVTVLVMLMRHMPASFVHLPGWALFLICAAGSAVIEFSTSWYLEKRFHAKWWDYSHFPVNIQGRICLPVTICFGLAGLALARFVFPWLSALAKSLPDAFFEIAALVTVGLIGADIALTEASMAGLLGRIEAAETEFTERAQKAYESMAAAPGQIKDSLAAAPAHARDALQAMAAQTTQAAARALTRPQKYILRKIRLIRPARRSAMSIGMGERIRRLLYGRKRDEQEAAGEHGREEETV